MKPVELILQLFHGSVVRIDNSLNDLIIGVKEDIDGSASVRFSDAALAGGTA